MLRWQGAAKLKQKGKNFYQLQAKSSDLKLTCEYAEQTSTANKTFAEVADAAKAYWLGYWKKVVWQTSPTARIPVPRRWSAA